MCYLAEYKQPIQPPHVAATKAVCDYFCSNRPFRRGTDCLFVAPSFENIIYVMQEWSASVFVVCCDKNMMRKRIEKQLKK
jgi:hypothetical protein